MAMIHRRKIFKTSAGIVLSDANVSIYLPGTSTAARIFDINGNLNDSAPQLSTDSDGYVDIYFDSDDYPEDQAFDMVCTPNVQCAPTENEVRLSSVPISTEWKQVAGIGATGHFRDTFEGTVSEIDNKWVVYDGTGETSKDATGGDAGGGLYAVGNNSGDDKRLMIHQESIPFDPNKTYRIKCSLKQTAGVCLAYIGVAGRNEADDAWINTQGLDSFQSQHYVTAGGVSPGSTLVEYVGYIKGTGALGDGTGHSDPADPAVLHQSCKYFRPLIYLNVGGPVAWPGNTTPWKNNVDLWQTLSSGAGTYKIDEFSVDVIASDAAEPGADITGDHTSDNTDHVNDSDTDPGHHYNVYEDILMRSSADISFYIKPADVQIYMARIQTDAQGLWIFSSDNPIYLNTEQMSAHTKSVECKSDFIPWSASDFYLGNATYPWARAYVDIYYAGTTAGLTGTFTNVNNFDFTAKGGLVTSFTKNS